MAVTRYMAAKWAKAVFEIIIAVVILIFGSRVLFGVIPADGQDTASFGLMVALLWFAVIWCIVAAVANIAKSLLPEPRHTISGLSERIEKLDKKLTDMGLEAPEAEIIPPSPEELKRAKTRKIAFAAITIAVMVIIASIGVFFMLAKMNAGAPAGGATPEDTLTALIERMNAKDAAGVVSLTVYAFGNTSVRAHAVQQIEQLFIQAGSAFHVTLTDHQIKMDSDMNASEQQNVAVTVGEIQNHTSIQVQDSCLVYYTMNITMTDGSMEMSNDMVGVKIDNAWYMMLEFGGPGPDSNQQQSASGAFWSFIDRVEQKDASGAIDLTVFKYGNSSERSQAEENISAMWQGSMSFQVNVDFMNVRNWSTLNPTEQSNLSSIQGDVSMQYGVSISESCFIQYTLTITNDSGPMTMTGNMPCFRIDNSWFLKLEESGGQPSFTVTINSEHPGAFYNLTITSITGVGSSINFNDVYITVIFSNSSVALNHMQLSMMPGGSYVNGTQFVEVTGPGTLDSGDYFMLDDTMFGPGAQFILENASGDQEYCHIGLS